MNILLTGKHGQLGFELQRALAPLGRLLAVGRRECNLADDEAVRRVVRAAQPDLIVNAAAYTAVDRAESEPEAAMAVNGAAPGVLGEEAERLGAAVVHYSTDYVFDGTQPIPYREADAANPLNVYGVTKLAGEQALARSCARHLILRTSWVVGAHGHNFARTILRLAAQREELTIVDDQYGAPTSAALLADVTAHLVGRMRGQGRAGFPWGLYHLAASGETTWHGYAAFVVAQALRAGRPLKVTPEKVRAITTADYPLPATRPANSRLDTTLFSTTFQLELPYWRFGVGHILQQILDA